MEEKAFVELMKNLEDLDYFFLSGFATHILTEGKRAFNDFDIAINEKDIEKFAKRVNAKVIKRNIDKETFLVDDFGFETVFNGLNIECTSGYPKCRMQNNTFNNLFSLRLKKRFMDKEVYVAPVEEMLVQKAYMHREKDLKDLQLFKGISFNKKLVNELAEDWGEKEKIIAVLKQAGFVV
jgi:hypothetical protein